MSPNSDTVASYSDCKKGSLKGNADGCTRLYKYLWFETQMAICKKGQRLFNVCRWTSQSPKRHIGTHQARLYSPQIMTRRVNVLVVLTHCTAKKSCGTKHVPKRLIIFEGKVCRRKPIWKRLRRYGLYYHVAYWQNQVLSQHMLWFAQSAIPRSLDFTNFCRAITSPTTPLYGKTGFVNVLLLQVMRGPTPAPPA